MIPIIARAAMSGARLNKARKSAGTEIGKQRALKGLRAQAQSLEEESKDKKHQPIGGIAYYAIGMLLLFMDIPLDTFLTYLNGLGVGLLASVIGFPVGVAIIFLTTIAKFFFLILAFISTLLFYKSRGVRVGTIAITSGLISILEMLPVINILPITATTFFLRVFVENRARKGRLASILVNLADTSGKIKHIGFKK